MLDVAAEHAGEAGDFVVLRVRGTEAESHLSCAGLHGLLRPVADRLPALPPAQATALTRALQLGAADGGLTLPAAVLNLLVAVDGPVLACVDDVHHLDAPSREALFFTARRLTGETVVLLFGADDGTAAPEDIPAFELGVLDEEAAGRLASDLAPGLTEDVRASLLEIARGNPLALVDLARSLSPEQLSGAAAPPETLPRGGRLWRAYADRLARMPGDTADMLLLLAADPSLETVTLLGAAEPRCALTMLEPAERAGVVVRVTDVTDAAGDRYDFREPAMRTVVYAGASLSRRRAAHRLLAGVLRHDHQRLRRAWHLAAATDGPDESLADELASAAAAAGFQGGHPASFLAFERAAELTAHGDVKAARLAAAANRAWRAGLPRRARSLLARLHSLTISEEVRSQAELIRGSLELRSGRTVSAGEDLMAAAESLLDRDRGQAVRVFIRAGEASYLAGDNVRYLNIARRAAKLRRPDDPAATQLMFEYLAGTAATFGGRHREAADPLRRVLELAPSVRTPSVLVWAGVASLLLGDDAQALRLCTRAVETARAMGAVSTVPQVLEFMIQAEIWMGRYASITANAVEGLRLAQESRQTKQRRPAPGVARAHRGRRGRRGDVRDQGGERHRTGGRPRRGRGGGTRQLGTGPPRPRGGTPRGRGKAAACHGQVGRDQRSPRRAGHVDAQLRRGRRAHGRPGTGRGGAAGAGPLGEQHPQPRPARARRTLSCAPGRPG